MRDPYKYGCVAQCRKDAIRYLMTWFDVENTKKDLVWFFIIATRCLLNKHVC